MGKMFPIFYSHYIQSDDISDMIHFKDSGVYFYNGSVSTKMFNKVSIHLCMIGFGASRQ